jgi:NAD(P)-dependent dehydrogenase (short-subunit alcohol dehydrogenase family)
MDGLVVGKVALVTGAGSGIGRASALAFAREGARVLVVDVDAATGTETVERVTAAGGEARFHRADVTREDEVAAMVDAAVAHFGRLDCAHNNAGIAQLGTPLHEVAAADWDRMIAVDLTSVFLCLKHEVRHMLGRPGGGAIVNTSSGAGVIGFPGLGAYVAAKHGVLGLTKTAALEYVAAGIRVNAICPGVTDTPMLRGIVAGDAAVEDAMKATLPAGEFGRPDQLAEAVVWLCCDRASWVAGESMLVDGASVCR